MAYVVLVPYPEVESLQLIGESGTRRYMYMADLQYAVPVVWYNQFLWSVLALWNFLLITI